MDSKQQLHTSYDFAADTTSAEIIIIIIIIIIKCIYIAQNRVMQLMLLCSLYCCLRILL